MPTLSKSLQFEITYLHIVLDCGTAYALGLKWLAQRMSMKWDKSFGLTTGWHAQNYLYRATNLCLRGSRTMWRSEVRIDDANRVIKL